MEKSNTSHASADIARFGSEADFLADQAAAAQRAMSVTLERMRADLGDTADLAAWARRYPWPTVGMAAAAGFLAVLAIRSPAASRANESSAAGESDASDEHADKHTRGRRSAEKDRGLFHSLMSELLRNFATAAQGALLAAIGARFQPPPAPPDNSPPVNDPAADPVAAGASGGNGFASSDS
jgi:ElaB/YqjD/DUF883 family membrane-anchored ribosome-binding protein